MGKYSLSKKMRIKFFLKYAIITLLALLLIFQTFILIEMFLSNWKEWIVYIDVFFVVVLFILIYCLYDKIKISDTNDFHNLFQEVYKLFEEGMSDLRYSEYITWVSRELFDTYLNKSSNLSKEDQEELNTLILLLRPNEYGLCTAFYHKNTFLTMCKELTNGENSRVEIIRKYYYCINNESRQKYHYFNGVLFDKNILAYLSILVIHVLAALIPYDQSGQIGFNEVVRNLMLYLPNDTLVILVYFGIINEHYKSKKDL